MVYALIFLMVLLIILNDISRKYLLYNLTYKTVVSKNIVEIGEEFEITTIVENKKILPITFLQVIETYPLAIEYKYKAEVFSTPEYLYHKATMSVMSHQRIKRTYKVFCKHRGKHVLKDISMVVGDFLAMQLLYKNLEYRQEIIALPQSADLEVDLVPYGAWYGDVSVKRWIVDDPLLTIGIDEYTGREPQKFIHWPSSLKTGRLMIRKFDYTTDNAAMIILNIECFKPFWLNIHGEKIEKCISISRSVVEQFAPTGVAYGFAANVHAGDLYDGRRAIPPGRGMAHYENILEILGRATFVATIEFEEIMETLINGNLNCATYVIITPAVLPSYVYYINTLSKNGYKTILISLKENDLESIDKNVLTYTGKDG